LINDVDVAATEDKIKRFQAENADMIDVNDLRRERESEIARLRDDEERREREARMREFQRMDQEEERQRQRDNEKLIRDLVRPVSGVSSNPCINFPNRNSTTATLAKSSPNPVKNVQQTNLHLLRSARASSPT
jgi:hypothetical protein